MPNKRFHELMATSVEAPESATARVASLCEAFLEWSVANQAADTYRGYRFFVQSFCEAAGFVLVRELKPFHATRWLAGKDWNDTSRYNALRSVFRVFNWAKSEGLVSANPLHGLKRPRPRSRERCLTDEEFRALLTRARGPFKQFLFALGQTGARPCELRQLRWEQVRGDRCVLFEHKTVGKTGKPRIVYLTPAVVRLLERLRRRSTSPHVFVNFHGKPWTQNAVRLQISRLKKKAGLRSDVCAYLIRHRFGTKAILNGVDLATVAELMGHVDTQMVSSVYVHLADQTGHLQAAVARAVNGAKTS